MKIDVQVQKKKMESGRLEKTPPLPSSSSSSSTVPISLPGSVHTHNGESLFSYTSNDDDDPVFKSQETTIVHPGHWDYELFLFFSFLKNRRQKRTFIFVKEKKAARCTYTHTRE